MAGPIKLVDREIGERERFNLAQLACHIDVLLNGLGDDRTFGFALMVFPYGDATGGECSYCSNGEPLRELAVLEAQVARFRAKFHQKAGRA